MAEDDWGSGDALAEDWGAGDKLVEPTTFANYPEIYAEENRAARKQMERGAEQLTSPTGGQLYESAKSTVSGLGNVGLGAFNYVTSPIAAALRTFVGNPLQERTGLPREYSEFAAGLAIPGYGLRSLGRAKPPELSGVSAPGLEREAAAQEFLPSGLTRGQATGDLEAIRTENLAARGALGKEAQDLAAARFEEQMAEAQQAGRNIGEEVSRGRGVIGVPAEGAEVVRGEVGDIAERARGIVTRAEEGAAAEARALEEGLTTRRQALATEREGLDTSLQGAHPPIESPREAGEMVAEGVRTGARRERGEASRLYDEAAAMEGTFRPEPFHAMGERFAYQLANSADPVLIDAINTPRAARAIAVLNDLPNLRLPTTGETLASGAPMDLRGVDQGRKQLTFLYSQARSAARSNVPNAATDARAIDRIITEYDNTIERAIANGLFSGDPAALDALQAARAAYHRYARTYRPQGAGDDVGQAIRRIVDRNATAEEVANMIIGSGRIGTKGLPVRIADRMEQILGPDSREWNSIQQAILQSTTARNTAGEVNALRTAQNITSLADSSLGRRMYTPETLTRMRDYAVGVRGLEQEVATLSERAAALPSRQAAERLRGTYQEVFGGEGIGGTAQTAFRRIVDGSATPEEIVNATFNVINAKSAGSAARFIDSVSRIVGENSASMSAIRQGVWQRLTQNALGKDQPGAQKLAQSINEFLNGSGKSIAQRLYNQAELDLMQRYADTLKRTVVPRFAQTGSDTAPALMQMLNQLTGAIKSQFLYHIPVVRYVAPLIPFVAGQARKVRQTEKLRQSLKPVTPATPPVKRPNLLRPALVPSGDEPSGMKSGGYVKVGKASVQYGKGMPSAHCGICKYYVTGGKCQRVAGAIKPEDWCKLFEKTKRMQAGGVPGDDSPPAEPPPTPEPTPLDPSLNVLGGISAGGTELNPQGFGRAFIPGADDMSTWRPYNNAEVLQQVRADPIQSADMFPAATRLGDPRVDAWYAENYQGETGPDAMALMGRMFQEIPDAGRGTILGGIGRLVDRPDNQYTVGSTEPSTNNWRLLPPMYQTPGHIARNGFIIDTNSWGFSAGYPASGPPRTDESGGVAGPVTGVWAPHLGPFMGFPASYGLAGAGQVGGWPGALWGWRSDRPGGGMGMATKRGGLVP